jgi:hypothetical protein
VHPTQIKSSQHSAAELDNQKSVQLSARQLMYLKNTSFLPDLLAAVIQNAPHLGTEKYVLKIAPEMAREFRSAFTCRLAKLALDSRYDPTTEGVILEQLLERFSDS